MINLAYTHHHITQSNGTWCACVDYLSSNTLSHTYQRIHSMPLPPLPGYLTAISPHHLVLPRAGYLLFVRVHARKIEREREGEKERVGVRVYVCSRACARV